jgi:thioredoxin 1
MSKILTLTGENFDKEVLKAELPVLVDFWAPWCAPCRMMAPVLEGLSTVFDGKLIIGKLDVDEPSNQSLASQYQIQSIPNLKLFKQGREIKNYIGYRDQDSFAKDLAAAL